MKRNIKTLTISEFFYSEELRDDYICYSHNKNHVNESMIPYYQKIVETIFENGPLEFIHMTIVKGYKQDEPISYEVNRNQEDLLAIHHFLKNQITYNGMTFEEMKKRAKDDVELKAKIMKFWNYKLYFQVFYKE